MLAGMLAGLDCQEQLWCVFAWALLSYTLVGVILFPSVEMTCFEGGEQATAKATATAGPSTAAAGAPPSLRMTEFWLRKREQKQQQRQKQNTGVLRFAQDDGLF
jgi:hypothetical protein